MSRKKEKKYLPPTKYRTKMYDFKPKNRILINSILRQSWLYKSLEENSIFILKNQIILKFLN